MFPESAFAWVTVQEEKEKPFPDGLSIQRRGGGKKKSSAFPWLAESPRSGEDIRRWRRRSASCARKGGKKGGKETMAMALA